MLSKSSLPVRALQRGAWIVATVLVVLLGASACTPGQAEVSPPEIVLGETVCIECNMIISDERFAAGYAHEVAEGRYESIAFDDIGDMLAHVQKHPEHQIVAWYVHDYDSKAWLDAAQAHFVVSREVQSPMSSGTAAFANAAAAQELAQGVNGVVYDWPGLQEQFQRSGLPGDVEPVVSPTAAQPETAAAGPSADVTTADGRTLHIVVLAPAEPAAQVQPFELLVTEQDTPRDGLTLTFDPQMPSMGHGSLHNEQPVSQGGGRYAGAVNFSMPGAWEVTVTVAEGDRVLGEAVLAFEVR